MTKTYMFKPHLTELGRLYNLFTPIHSLEYFSTLGETLIIENGQITGIVVERKEPIKKQIDEYYDKLEETFNRR